MFGEQKFVQGKLSCIDLVDKHSAALNKGKQQR
ncbi:MAG TPA: hypothetical protein DIT43_03535 [Dehalococcoidia bacterium]|nr:hypothetical protein [Dehalococcoidia bacterium]